MINIIFFTEGGKTQGFGHITRCSSIADALKKNNPETNICLILNGDSSVNNIISGFDKLVFDDWCSDGYIETLLSKNKYDIAFIDSYNISEDKCKYITEKCGTTVFIDDFNRIKYSDKSIIINGTIGAENIDYKKNKTQTYLLGVDYAYLRKEFWTKEKRSLNKNIKNILISLGGSDIRNLTPKILESLSFLNYNKIVFATDAMSNISEIESFSDANTNIIYNPSAEEIKTIMQKCDAGILAAGQIIVEAVSTDLPCVTVQTADNQKLNVKFWKEKGIIKHAGSYEDKELPEKILLNLTDLEDFSVRQNIINATSDLIDGKGSLRIARRIIKEHITKNLIISPAETSDTKAVYYLSNQNSVRQNSYSPEKINYTDHLKWFAKILESENEQLLLAKFSDKLAGQVRFSFVNRDITVSISVDERFQGMSLGKTILKKGIEHLKISLKGKYKLIAYVKTNNKVSEKLFLSLGFVKKEIVTIKDEKSYKFELDIN